MKKYYLQQICFKKCSTKEFKDSFKENLKINFKNVCTMMKLIVISLTLLKRMDRK